MVSPCASQAKPLLQTNPRNGLAADVTLRVAFIIAAGSAFTIGTLYFVFPGLHFVVSVSSRIPM
jgi:hypothetical protein